MHIAWNPTLRCDLRCHYCWIDEAGVDRDVSELPVGTWMEYFGGFDDLAVDIIGGEPLLYDGTGNMIAFLEGLRFRWAITTNLESPAWDMLAQPFHYCNIINISLHRRDFFDEQWARAECIRATGNIVGWNLVSNNGDDWAEEVKVLTESGFQVNWTPYAPPQVSWLDAQTPYRCDGGQNSLWIAPNGDVYRCWTHVKAKTSPLGNILDGYRGQPITDVPCGLKCEASAIEGNCGLKVLNVCQTCKKRPGTPRVDNGLPCGTHCDQCFDSMISECRSRSW